MSWLDVLRFSTDALSQHRRRSVLSLLGVSIGIIAVISLTAIGEGARRYVEQQFDALGSGLLIMMPGKTETSGGFPGGVGGVPNDLTLEDAEALKRHMPEVERIVPMTVSTAPISHLERSRRAMIVGSTADFKLVRDLSIVRGRFLGSRDLQRAAPEAVIGRKLARELFGESDPVGQRIRVGDVRMRVLGVLAARGTQMGMDVDDSVVIPVATGMRMTNNRSLSRVLMKLRPYADVEKAKRRAIEIITDRHDEEDVTVLTQEAVMGALSSIVQALTLALVGIAAISLTVAGIGIMNVMLVSVSERTSEVGLLKALGASRRQVLAIFLVEAVLLSGAGGAAGLGLGLGLVACVTWLYPALPAAAPIWAVAAVLAISAATGVVFGVLPAWRAARLDPIAALAAR